MSQERDEKRFDGAFAKFATTASEVEQKIWRECSREFGYKWISTPVEVRQSLIDARLAAASKPK